MFGRRFELFRAFGIPIAVDLSWFVVAVLVAWSLAENLFPGFPETEGLGRVTYWWMGIVGSLGLFASVVLHELAHALVARRFGLPIRGITLFIFGGVAEMGDEPPSPWAEFLVAIAGPLASVAIGIGGFTAAAVGNAGAWPATVTAVLSSLDGGRVLRSLLWRWKGDLRWATRITSTIGSGFGVAMIAVGILRVVLRGDLFGGMWMFLIGMFLRNAAQISYRQLLFRRGLEGEPVGRFMKPDPISVSRALSVADLVENYVYRHHFKLFPVVDGDRLVGCVTTRGIQSLPREEWPRQSVGAIAEPCSPENTVTPDSDALEALSKMSRNGASRLMVVEGDRLVGILTLKDLLGFLALKVELEDGDGSRPPAP